MFEYLIFKENEFESFSREIKIEIVDGKIQFLHQGNELVYNINHLLSSGIFSGDSDKLISDIEKCHVEEWENSYFKPIVDGHSWALTYKQVGKRCKHIIGSNSYPKEFDVFRKAIYRPLYANGGNKSEI